MGTTGSLRREGRSASSAVGTGRGATRRGGKGAVVGSECV
jgi:hypothetical protein